MLGHFSKNEAVVCAAVDLLERACRDSVNATGRLADLFRIISVFTIPHMFSANDECEDKEEVASIPNLEDHAGSTETEATAVPPISDGPLPGHETNETAPFPQSPVLGEVAGLVAGVKIPLKACSTTTQSSFLRAVVCMTACIDPAQLTQARANILFARLYFLTYHSSTTAETRSIATGALQLLYGRVYNHEKRKSYAPAAGSVPAKQAVQLVAELMPNLVESIEEETTLADGEPQKASTVFFSLLDKLVGRIDSFTSSRCKKAGNLENKAMQAAAEGRLSDKAFFMVAHSPESQIDESRVEAYLEGAEIAVALDVVRYCISDAFVDCIGDEQIAANNFRGLMLNWVRQTLLYPLIRIAAVMGLVAFPLSVVLRYRQLSHTNATTIQLQLPVPRIVSVSSCHRSLLF